MLGLLFFTIKVDGKGKIYGLSDLDEIDSKVINKENIDLIIQVDYEDFIDASVNQLKNSSITRL